jgi:hypothetical protein
MYDNDALITTDFINLCQVALSAYTLSTVELQGP